MVRRIETTEGVKLSSEDFEIFSPTNCNIYFLSDRQVALLYSLLRYAEWKARWEGEPDFDLVYDTEGTLLSTCDDFVIQLRRIANALYLDPDAGQVQLNVDAGIQDDQGIAQLIGGQEEQDYSDELANIGAILGYLAI